jgi:hypothetical protein
VIWHIPVAVWFDLTYFVNLISFFIDPKTVFSVALIFHKRRSKGDAGRLESTMHIPSFLLDYRITIISRKMNHWRRIPGLCNESKSSWQYVLYEWERWEPKYSSTKFIAQPWR